jgi:hypothetical protein
MGGIWLYDLPDVLAAAGLTVETWPGWENRARGSGGYDAVRAVFAHHTASNTSPDSDRSYMWDSSSGDQPIGALYLARDGIVTVGAAGATNTQGKGGPWNLSTGTIPKDQGNAYGIAIEAANAGTGEPWPAAQTDAYLAACSALCAAYGLDPDRDVLSHREWCEPSCPGRKIDPAGPSPWATGAASWNMAGFRADVAAGVVRPIPPNPTDPGPVPPDPTNELEDPNMSTFLLRNRDSGQIVLLAYDGAGITAHGMAGEDLDGYVARFGPWIDTNPIIFDEFIRKSNE